MKHLDLIKLTKSLNELRLSQRKLSPSEFRTIIRSYISYPRFATLLIEEGYGTIVNKHILFSKTPIHYSKVEQLVKQVRDVQYSYNKKYTKQKCTYSLEQAILELKKQGYMIIKPVEML